MFKYLFTMQFTKYHRIISFCGIKIKVKLPKIYKMHTKGKENADKKFLVLRWNSDVAGLFAHFFYGSDGNRLCCKEWLYPCC